MLRVWARGLLGLEAAVELLAGHRFWLRRSDFLAVAVQVERDPATGDVWAWVDFEAAAAVLHAAGLGARPVLVEGGPEGRGRW